MATTNKHTIANLKSDEPWLELLRLSAPAYKEFLGWDASIAPINHDATCSTIRHDSTKQSIENVSIEAIQKENDILRSMLSDEIDYVKNVKPKNDLATILLLLMH